MRRACAGLAIALAVAALPHVTVGLVVWTFAAAPLTVTAGQGTVFTMTATNVAGPDDLGCMEVTLPSSFSISTVGTPVASNGDKWAARRTGTTIEVRSLSGGGRLNVGESVTFQVTATPASAGLTSWPNHAHKRQDCRGLNEAGVPVPVVVLPPILATPLPTPRPTQMPTPKPLPTEQPTPIPLPVRPPPTPQPEPTVAPTSERSVTPRPSASALEVPSSSPSPLVGASSPTPTPSPDAGAGISVPRMPADPAPVSLGTGTLTMLDGFGTWSVPVAVVGVPGLLVVLWVVLQTVGALAWIPAVRRLRGENRARDPRTTR